jgi:hypothetical protein
MINKDKLLILGIEPEAYYIYNIKTNTIDLFLYPVELAIRLFKINHKCFKNLPINIILTYSYGP